MAHAPRTLREKRIRTVGRLSCRWMPPQGRLSALPESSRERDRAVARVVKADERDEDVARALFPELSAVSRLAAVRRCTAHARCSAPVIARGLKPEPWGKCEVALREDAAAKNAAEAFEATERYRPHAGHHGRAA